MISVNTRRVNYSFPHHSAGPFRDDISGPFMTASNFFRVLAIVGLGWKDIHATNIEQPDTKYAPQPELTISIKF